MFACMLDNVCQYKEGDIHCWMYIDFIGMFLHKVSVQLSFYTKQYAYWDTHCSSSRLKHDKTLYSHAPSSMGPGKPA